LGGWPVNALSCTCAEFGTEMCQLPPLPYGRGGTRDFVNVHVTQHWLCRSDCSLYRGTCVEKMPY